MAFSYTVTKKIGISRTKSFVWGTFTNGANDSGGAVSTGLKACDVWIPVISSHTGGTGIKTSISGGTVTIVTDDDVDGTWFAIGT